MKFDIKPAASKSWLLLEAGLMWTGVGLLLCSFSARWLADIHTPVAVIAGTAGLAGAFPVYRFGFIRIATRNIARLEGLLDKTCLFAFMPLKNYLLVAIMMSVGIVLRNSTIPKLWLSVLYTVIGASLFLSSLHYYPRVLNGAKLREEH